MTNEVERAGRLVFGKNLVSVLGNEGAEQARYNHSIKGDHERAKIAAAQAVNRGDLPYTGYVAFVAAMEGRYKVKFEDEDEIAVRDMKLQDLLDLVTSVTPDMQTPLVVQRKELLGTAANLNWAYALFSQQKEDLLRETGRNKKLSDWSKAA